MHPGCLQVGPDWRPGGELHASDSWISTAVLWRSSVLHFLHILLTYVYFTPILLSASPRPLDKRRCIGADKLCPDGLCGLRTGLRTPCMCNQSQRLDSFSNASLLCGSSLFHLLFISSLLSADQQDALAEA